MTSTITRQLPQLTDKRWQWEISAHQDPELHITITLKYLGHDYMRRNVHISRLQDLAQPYVANHVKNEVIGTAWEIFSESPLGIRSDQRYHPQALDQATAICREILNDSEL